MGIKLSNVLVSLVIMAILVSLVNTIYNKTLDEYSLTTDATVDGLSPFQKLDNLQLMTGINQSITGLYELTNPTASAVDLLGGLATTAVGFLKTVTGVLTFPIGIIDVYTDFIEIPDIIYIGLGIIIIIYIGFALLDKYNQNQN